MEQPFTDVDLWYNLEVMGIDLGYERFVHIHIYAFHEVSPAVFVDNANYNIYVHPPNELREYMLGFQQDSATTQRPRVGRGSGRGSGGAAKVVLGIGSGAANGATTGQGSGIGSGVASIAQSASSEL